MQGQLKTTKGGPGSTKSQARDGPMVSKAALQPPVPASLGVDGSRVSPGGLGAARWPKASNKIPAGWRYEHGLYWD